MALAGSALAGFAGRNAAIARIMGRSRSPRRYRLDECAGFRRPMRWLSGPGAGWRTWWQHSLTPIEFGITAAPRWLRCWLREDCPPLPPRRQAAPPYRLDPAGVGDPAHPRPGA